MNVGRSRRQGRIVPPYEQLNAKFPGQPIAVFDGFGDLETRIDVNQGYRHVPKKRLPGQPQQNGRVLAHRPQHAEAIEMPEGFPQDVNALALEFIKFVHASSVARCSIAVSTENPNPCLGSADGMLIEDLFLQRRLLTRDFYVAYCLAQIVRPTARGYGAEDAMLTGRCPLEKNDGRNSTANPAG